LRVAIYARVSSVDQNYEMQLQELNALADRSGWAVVDVYAEKISGTKKTEDRPELKRLMKDAKSRKFQKVLVWSVDRLGRSMKNLVDVLSELRDLKIDIFAQQQGIDTGTQMGSMMFSFISIFSEFETNLRRERQMLGIQKARKNGKRWGGRQPTADDKIEKIRLMRSKGLTVREICKKLKVSPNTVAASKEPTCRPNKSLLN
jgi:DNA invertase Pin-like site-specific DNA recombinase